MCWSKEQMTALFDEFELWETLPKYVSIEDLLILPGVLMEYGPEDYDDEVKRRKFVVVYLMSVTRNEVAQQQNEWKMKTDRLFDKIDEHLTFIVDRLMK